MRQCLCDIKPTIIRDDMAGEVLCSSCGTVVYEKEANAMWERENRQDASGRFGDDIASIAQFATTRRIVIGTNAKRCAELTRMMSPILKHVSATNIMADEAGMLARRIIQDEFAKGKVRLNVCVGIVLAVCRVHGRVVKCKELAVLTGTNVKQIRRLSMDIMERYDLKPLSIEDRTRRIISRMCADIGKPELLRPAINTYDAMVRLGHATGKNPHVVAAHALRMHTNSIMSKEQFAEIVGVSRQSVHRYVAGYVNVC